MNQAFTVLVRRNDGAEARLGMAIARKRVRLATARNRIKRIVRESFRTHRTILPPVDVVVLAKPAAATLSNELLFRLLHREWQRVGDARGEHAQSAAPGAKF